MSQNIRKEPTFNLGETAPQNEPESITPDIEKGVSVRTQRAPAFTFTHIERPFLNQEPAKKETAEASAAPEVAPNTAPAEPKSEPTVIKETAQVAESALAGVTAERASASAAQASTQEPAKKVIKPTKNRRLLIVILLAALLGLVIWLLQPKTPQTLDELQQQQGTNLPIEFRPVDEAEAKRAEEQAMQNAQAQQAQQATEVTPEQQATSPAQQNSAPETMTAPATQPLQSHNGESVSPMQPIQPQPAQTEAVNQTPAVQVQTAKPVAHPAPAKEEAVRPVKQVAATPVVAVKPKTQNSVIYQPEQAKAEQVKPAQAVKKPEVEKKVVAKEPTAQPKETVHNAVKATAAPASSSAKTLTVPKGVSLMQVFRDNNLNISDVNAMSKAAGANGILSNLNAGERVNVRLDSNNRVTEMSLSRGGKFVRQADGSYSFRK